MAFHTKPNCSWTLFADAPDNEDSSEQSDEDYSDEEEDQSESEATTSTSYNDSPVASFGGSTSGISSMNSSEHMRAINSACTLDDLFREDHMDDESDIKNDLEIDEGFVAEKPLDVDVNFVINLTQQNQATPQAAALPTPVPSVQPETASQSYVPLKHFLKPICTIGTGTFGRVELTQHKETQEFYALKSMYIPSILERRQLSHVFNEKYILSKLQHPFIVKLYDTAKDSRYLYVIMDYLSGGELFSYLRMTRTLPSPIVKFYAAEIILALEYMHSMNFAYRDLKPENLMLDRDGHVVLTDFGFAKKIDSKSYSLCGTSEYLAPELANRKGHTVSVDLWALGVLIFELIAGFTPFGGSSVDEVQASIQANPIPEFPHKTFSANNKNIIKQLLSIEPKDRKTATEVKQNPWFAEICFEDLLAKKIKTPIKPTVHSAGDTGNFDTYEEILDKQPPAKQRDIDLFDEW
ncbi:CAMP-dependent protein kinase catalytic subunit PRKX [Aphelenchoides bicaudatus]|nr:CAMP-dependent protein kinase catalytic subunit PRKX [Aphelenchoides bicaudatus]